MEEKLKLEGEMTEPLKRGTLEARRHNRRGEASTAVRCASVGGPSIVVGDAVVYGAHGVGRVVARLRATVAGAERDSIVVELDAGLRVTLPLEETAGRLRAVADAADLVSVGKTLGAEPAGRAGTAWTKRIKDSKLKLAAGRTTDLAELVRDGAPFEHPEAGLPRLSEGERRLYRQARRLLVREIGLARGVADAEAEAWIDAQQKPRG